MAALLAVLQGSMQDAEAAELLMFEAPGCEWCEQWHDDIGTIYDNTDEGNAAPLHRFVIRQPLPSEFSFVKGIVYTPTFVLVHEGRELGRILGYPGEMHFWGLLGELLSRQTANDTKQVSADS